MDIIIDRFEGNFAIVELPDATTVNLSKQLIPPGAKEGDTLSITINPQKTKEQHDKIAKLMDELFTD